MPINIDNAQFKQFVGFAKDVGGRTIVQTGGATDEGQMQVQAKSTSDFIGNIGRGKASRDVNDDVRALFKQTVLDMFGVTDERNLPPAVRKAMNLRDYGKGKPLTARRIMAVNAAITKEMTRALHLSGNAAGIIGTFVATGSGILESPDPAQELATRMRTIAKAELQTHVAQQLGPALNSKTGLPQGVDCLDRYDTSFDKDVPRGQNITLSDGTKISRDPHEARRQLTVFVTGDSQATFDTVDAATKKKVHVLMACLNQGFTGCMMTGVGGSFDAKASSPVLSSGELSVKRQQSFVLSKDDAGNIVIDHKMRFRGPAVANLNANDGRYFLGKTDKNGYFDYSIKVLLRTTSLAALGNADWGSYNHGPVEKFRADRDQFVGASQLIPTQYKLDCDILDYSFEVHVDRLLGMDEQE